MIMSDKPMKFILLRVFVIAVIHTAVLGWMVWERATLLREGQEVVLSVVPVDPRDLLRGDYVALRFDISAIDLNEIEADVDFTTGSSVFIGLKKTESGIWKAVSATHQRPRSDSDIIFIKGLVRFINVKEEGAKELHIKYGIEKYFVPEGEGKKLEALTRDKVISIVAAVSQAGEAGIKTLLIRGKSVYEEPIF